MGGRELLGGGGGRATLAGGGFPRDDDIVCVPCAFFAPADALRAGVGVGGGY